VPGAALSLEAERRRVAAASEAYRAAVAINPRTACSSDCATAKITDGRVQVVVADRVLVLRF
jgi:hypothetical protein